MLRGQHDRVDFDRLAIDVTESDLRLGVRAQPGQAAVLTQFALALNKAVRVPDRGRHQIRGFVAGVAEHQALVAGTLVQVVFRGAVNALGDIGRLLVVGNKHRAAFVIDPVIGIVVTDTLDGVARHLDVVDVGGGGDFAREHHEARVAEGFGSYARVRILREDRVEDGIGNLVGNLVGVPFRNGFRGEEIVV